MSRTGHSFDWIGVWLLGVGMKGALVLAIAAILAVVLRRSSAATRHFVWLTAFGALLLVPVLVAITPAWRVLPDRIAWNAAWERVTSTAADKTVGATGPVGNIEPTGRAVPLSLGSGYRTADDAAGLPGRHPNEPAPAAAFAMSRGPLVGVFVWAIGVIVALLPIVAGWFEAWRLERRCVPATDGPLRERLCTLAADVRLTRPVRLLIAHDGVMPMTWGTRRPRILLPMDAAGWPAARLDVVLRHELAHVVRQDCLSLLVARVARALHWPNPLAWLALRRLVAEQERACDDRVLAAGTRASAYAEHLLSFATATPARVGIAMARANGLEKRMTAILDHTHRRGPLRPGHAAVLAGVLGMAVAPIAALRGQARAADRAPPATSPARTPATPEDGAAILTTPANASKESGAALSDVIEHLRRGSGRMIFVNWEALAAPGITPTLPVTTDLSGLTLGQALDRLIKAISGTATPPVSFVVIEQVVTLSTADDLASNVDTRTYDVRGVLGANDADRPLRVAALLRRVRGIDPMSWKDNGGRLGSVRELGGQLIVTSTPTVHRKILDELGPDLTPDELARLRGWVAWRPAEGPPAATLPAAADRSPLETTMTAMRRRWPRFDIDRARFGDVLTEFEIWAGVSVDVEWSELAKVGLTPGTPVSVRLRNVSADKVLTVLLSAGVSRRIDAGDAATSTIRPDGRIVVTTKRDLFARYATSREYSLEPFVRNCLPADRPALIKNISALVTETIDSDNWAPSPGKPGGTLDVDGDTLRVTQTAATHNQIATLFRRLQDQRRAAGTDTRP